MAENVRDLVSLFKRNDVIHPRTILMGFLVAPILILQIALPLFYCVNKQYII